MSRTIKTSSRKHFLVFARTNKCKSEDIYWGTKTDTKLQFNPRMSVGILWDMVAVTHRNLDMWQCVSARFNISLSPHKDGVGLLAIPSMRREKEFVRRQTRTLPSGPRSPTQTLGASWWLTAELAKDINYHQFSWLLRVSPMASDLATGYALGPIDCQAVRVSRAADLSWKWMVLPSVSHFPRRSLKISCPATSSIVTEITTLQMNMQNELPLAISLWT